MPPAKTTKTKKTTKADKPVKKVVKVVKPKIVKVKTCEDYTVVELREMATKKKIVGRSKMNKADLCTALKIKGGSKAVKPITPLKVTKSATKAQALLITHHLLTKESKTKESKTKTKIGTPLKITSSIATKMLIKNDAFDDTFKVTVIPGNKWSTVKTQAEERWGRGRVLLGGKAVTATNIIPNDVKEYTNLNFENTGSTPMKPSKRLPSPPKPKKKALPKTPKRQPVLNADSEDEESIFTESGDDDLIPI
jgi:hypothetical protein